MKLILTTFALFFTFSAVAALAILPPPKCNNGRLEYINAGHAAGDFCINKLKAKHPLECNQIMMSKTRADQIKIQDEFFTARRIEVCGK